MCIFLQPERKTHDGYAFYENNQVFEDKVFEPLIDAKRVGTLNKQQRNMINEGIDQVNREDDAIKTCLKATNGRGIGFLGEDVVSFAKSDGPSPGRYGHGSNEGAVSHLGGYDTS